MNQGLNAVITGSTSGIGQGIAEAFAKAGMNIMLNGFGDPNAEERTADFAAYAYLIGPPGYCGIE